MGLCGPENHRALSNVANKESNLTIKPTWFDFIHKLFVCSRGYFSVPADALKCHASSNTEVDPMSRTVFPRI
ncbi:hypothetical protein Thiowin_03825 [Thiorhodovibrio winogradskyi]|uniref:Uncharacterized protein n=1 Tax=Thiorhodovibrio winogradskyi TaxID=77007 RepID=A0ABZ0SCV4_9GAMM